MAQLILTVEDNAMLSDLKRAVKMLRGVVSVTVKKETGASSKSSKETAKAVMEAMRGDFAGELDTSSKENLRASIMAL